MRRILSASIVSDIRISDNLEARTQSLHIFSQIEIAVCEDTPYLILFCKRFSVVYGLTLVSSSSGTFIKSQIFPISTLNRYLRKTEIPVDIVSLEELFEENVPVSEDEWMRQLLYQDDDFNFEEECLATAYAELPLMRQQILKFLYVDELTVGEIAKRLNCSAQYVSDQKQKGLKHLRKKMSEGGDENG